MDNNPIGKK